MTPTSEISIAAVVVTYNRKALLLQCLEALQGQTRPVDRVVVVDNASTDGTAAAVRADFPDVELLQLDENRGGAGGFHAGMQAAVDGGADWVWVMDDDAEPAPDALGALLRTDVATCPDTVGLTSLVSGPRRGPQVNHSGWYDPIRMRYRFSPPDGAPVEPINYASFVGLLVRAPAVEAVGLPDARFFLRGDDNEYSLRLCRVGRMYLVRDSVIDHHDAFDAAGKQANVPRWQQDRPVRDYWVQYYVVRNKLLMVHDHAATPAQRGAGLVIGTLRTIARIGAVLAFDSDKATRVRVLLRGWMDGLRNVRGKQIDPASFIRAFS